MEFWNLLLLVVIGAICLYAFIDRICDCVERRGMSRVLSSYLANTKKDINEAINDISKLGSKGGQ